MPQERTRTSTSFEFSVGTGTSSIFMGLPTSCIRAAFIVSGKAICCLLQGFADASLSLLLLFASLIVASACRLAAELLLPVCFRLEARILSNRRLSLFPDFVVG